MSTTTTTLLTPSTLLASELAPMLDNGEISDITLYIAGGGNEYNTPFIIAYEKELKKRAKITKQ